MKQIKKSVLKQGFFQSTINFNDAMSELSCGFRFSYTVYVQKNSLMLFMTKNQIDRRRKK